MTSSQKKWAIRIGAAVVVVAVIVGVWKFVARRRRSIFSRPCWQLACWFFCAFKIRANRKTKVIFGFYVAANEILIDGERSRYHFEIAEVIKTGEKVVQINAGCAAVELALHSALCIIQSAITMARSNIWASLPKKKC